MRAARAHAMPVVTLLLSDVHRAAPLARNRGGINALMMSCLGDFFDSAHALLPFGGMDATTDRGLDPFMLTALGNHLSCFHLLLPHADLQRRDVLGRDASDIARDKGHDEKPPIIAAELARREALAIDKELGASRVPNPPPLRI